MAQIPDYSKEPLFDREAVQENKEITLQNAWNDLQAMPSYVERYAASNTAE